MDHRNDDQLYWQAIDYVTRGGRPAISHLQIRFKVGFDQAERWVRRMAENGVISLPRDRLH
jgi:DNA segregation ATPase FtsK/SpoIIIE-like protein